jgi:hypothetical protein
MLRIILGCRSCLFISLDSGSWTFRANIEWRNKENALFHHKQCCATQDMESHSHHLFDLELECLAPLKEYQEEVRLNAGKKVAPWKFNHFRGLLIQ